MRSLRYLPRMSAAVSMRATGPFLPFRFPLARTPQATEVRSTVIVSGIQAVRARNLYDAYMGHLAPPARAEVQSLIAGMWIPISLGLDHYGAMGRLALDPITVDAIGAEVADRLNRSALSIAVKLSKEAGVTPWTALAQAHRITDINWRGSDVMVHKLGPKEARYDWVGQPCAGIPYFVAGFAGFLRALVGLFCSRAFIRSVPERGSPTTVSYRLSWV
jgi:hypothetical protein